MGDGGLVSFVEEGWESFLDWGEERGVQLRSITDALEQRGIPSLPAFLLLLLVIAVGAWLVLGPILAGPQTGEVQVILNDEGGKPIQGALVKVTSSSGTPSFSRITDYTDKDGKVSFRSVNAERVTVSASYAGYSDAQQEIEVTAGKAQPVLLSTARIVEKTVSVKLSISGPADDLKTKTELQDEYYNTIEERTGLSPTFSVSRDKSFNVRVTSPGFSEQYLSNQTARSSDVFLTVELKPIAAKKPAKIHALVIGRDRKPLANASVQLVAATTDAVLANLSTGEDGSTQAAELEVGTQFKARASKQGYLTAVSELNNAQQDGRVEISLNSVEDEQKLFVEVRDGQGKAIEGPTVRLYQKISGSAEYALVSEQKPLEGKSEFLLEKTTEYLLSAWAPGYLPKAIASAKPGTRVVQLKKASGENSAKLKVHARNFDGTDAAAASVSLRTADGSPSGIPEKVTGVDGVQIFDAVPLAATAVRAEGKGRKGSATVDVKTGEQSVEVLLARASGLVRARVVDSFSIKPVANALVLVEGLNASSCKTGENGECAIEAPEFAGASATISAPGYEDYQSSQFAITPNADYVIETQMFPLSVRATTKLAFIGFFDSRGSKVTELAPASEYRARFLIRSPPLPFNAAQAFVSIGRRSEALEKSSAAITSFGAAGSAAAFAGTGFELASSLPIAGNSTIPLASNAPQAAVQGVEEYKWVHFEYPKFVGTREMSVGIRTRAVETGLVELHYRSAFAVESTPAAPGAGTAAAAASAKVQVVRNPDDSEAGISKSDLLANDVFETIAIGFEGKCERGACVQLYFEDSSGKRPLGNYQTDLGSEFKLAFRAFAGNESLQADVETSSIALGLLRGQSGTEETLPKIDSSTGSQTLSLHVAPGGEGFFTLRGQRLANDALLKFTLKKSGASAFEKSAYIRVASQGIPLLRVSANPRALLALHPVPVEFTVTDSLGIPVKGARVTIGSVEDAIGRPIEAIERENGKYVAEEVVAGGVGSARYTVEAQGFAKLSSTLRTSANKLLELREEKLGLAVLSRNEVVRGEFSAINLVENELAASLFVVKQGTPEILQLDIQPVTARVGRKASLNGFLQASIADYVLGIAQRQRSLNETILGKVVITASTGTTRQTLELPFSATASVAQLAIDSAWETDKQAIEFALAGGNAPGALTQTVDLAVTNNAPHPLLFNQQLNARGVRVSPLSLEVQPGETGVFKLTATKRPGLDGGCVFGQSETSGQIELHASFQGIASKKVLPIGVALSASGNCLPNSAQRLSLPVGMRAQLPIGSKVRKNEDGSYAALLPDSSLVGFSQAGVLEANEITLPPSEAVLLDGKLVSVSSDGRTRSFTLPFEAVLSIPTGVSVIRRGERFLAILGDSQLSMPSTVLFADTKAERQVRVPAGTRLEFAGAPTLDAATNPEVALPAKIIFQFPSNSLLRNAQDNSPTVQLPTGEVFDFSLEALADAQQRDGRVSISAPAGSKVLVPPNFYQKLSNNGFSLQLPFAAQVEVSSDTEVVQRRDGVAALLQDYDLLVPSGTAFQASQGGKKANLPAGSLLQFHLIDDSALSKNNFYSLPVDLLLAIPASARVDESAAAKTIGLDGGVVLGLPADATIGSAQTDGSRLAQVPAGSQISAPTSFIQNLPRGGFRLTPQMPYSIGVATGTAVLERQASKAVQLKEYDVVVPASATFSEKDGLMVSSLLRAGQAVTITPPPDISLTNNVRVVLPFDLEIRLPAGTRVKTLSDTTGVLLPGNRPLGIREVKQAGNFTVARAPAGTPMALPPEMVLAATNSSTKIVLSLEATAFFEAEAKIFRGTGEIEAVGNGYKAFLPASAKLSSSESGAKAAQLLAGQAFTVEAAIFDLLAQEYSLPIELSFRIPENGLLKARDDGRTYFESGSAKMVFASGAAIGQGVVSAPENTPIKFSPGLFEAVKIDGIPASTSRPRNFRLTLPFAYSFSLPANAQLIDTLKGKAYIVADAVVVFPTSARALEGSGAGATAGTGAAASKQIEVPANAATLFLAFFPGILGKLNSNAEIFSSLDARAAALSKNNKVVVVPAKMEIIAPPEVNATAVTGGTALFLSQSEVIVIQAPAQLQASRAGQTLSAERTVELSSANGNGLGSIWLQAASANAPQTIALEAGSQISLPPQHASVAQDGTVVFRVPLQTSITVPVETEVIEENGKVTFALQNPAVDLTVPASVEFKKSSSGETVARLQPGTKIEIRPFGQLAANGVMVRLPVDVDVLLPTGTRTTAQGAGTLVRFPDGSVAQFQGMAEIGAANAIAASAASNSTGTTKLLRWQAGTNAQLPASAAAADASGSFTVKLPVPASVILPQDARLTRRGFGILATLQGGTRVELPQSARIAPSSAGLAASIAANEKFTAGPFLLDVQGPSVTMPFDVSLQVPADALVNDFAAGGVVVEFTGGIRAKFAQGSLAGTSGVRGFSQPGSSQPIFVGGFGGSSALNPFAPQANGQFAAPQAFGGFSGFGIGAGIGAAGQIGSGQGSITSPRLSPITTSPGLASGGFGAGSGYSGSLGAGGIQSLALPVQWVATMEGDYPPMRNPDGSYSIISQNVEARFPAGSSIISGGAGGFGGFAGASSLNQFNGFSGISGFGSGGSLRILVPAFARVTALPSFINPNAFNQNPFGQLGNQLGGPGLSGQPIAFPFDLRLQGASVFPIGASGGQLIGWPGGALQLSQPLSSSAFGPGFASTSDFGGAGLLPGGRGFGSSPFAGAVSQPDLLIPAGTSMVFSPGILQQLPGEQFPQKQQARELRNSGQQARRVAISTQHNLEFLGNDNAVLGNRDGTFSVDTEKSRIVVPHQPSGADKPIAFIQRGEHFDMIPLGIAKSGAGNGIALPVDSDFSAVGLQQKKIEGQQTRLDAGSGRFIDFPPQVDASPASIKVSAGTSFKPSPEIAVITSPIEWRMTAPTIITLILSDKTEFIESEGRQAIPAGEANLLLPRGVTPLKAGTRLIATIPAGSTLEMKPLSKTGEGARGAYDAQTTPITLPLDISFSTVNAQVLPPTQDGRFAAKFRERDVIVFNAGTKYDKLAGSVTVRAGETFFPSNNLLPLAPLPTDRGSESFLLPPAEIQRLRFVTPAQASLATKPEHKITKESGALVVRTQFQEVRVPGNSGQTNGNIVLSTNDVIEVGPLDYLVSDLQQISVPLTSFFKLPSSTRIVEDPSGQYKVARLPGRVKIGFSGRAEVNVKTTGEKLVKVAGDDKIFVSRGSLRKIAGDGFELRLPVEWGVVTEPNSAKVDRLDGTWALRVPGRAALNTIVLPFEPNPVARPINFAETNTLSFDAEKGIAFLQDAPQPGERQTQSNAPSFLTDAAQPNSIVTRQKSFPAAFVEIPARTRVQIITVRGDLVDKAQGPVGDAETELALNEKMFLEIPLESEVTQNGFSATVTHARCASPSEMAIKSIEPNTKQVREVLKLPAHIQITATQAEVAGTEEGGRVMRLQKGSKISLKTCDHKKEESRTFTQIYPGKVKYTLPASAQWKATQETDTASFPQCADVIVKNGVVSAIKNVEKIVFRKGATYLEGGPSKQGLASVVEVPAATPVDIVVCRKPGSVGSVEIEGTTNLMQFEKPIDTPIKQNEALKITLDSTDLKQATVCVKNIGPASYFAEATSVGGEAAKFIDATRIVWNTPAGPRPQSIAPTREHCTDISQIPVRVPEGSSYLDARGCLLSRSEPVKGYIQYSTSNGNIDSSAKKATAALKVEITLVASPQNCKASVELLGFHRTNGFHATYAQTIKETGLSDQTLQQEIVFKNSGHTRYFALVNNRLESVLVKAVNEPDNARAAACSLSNGKEIQQEEFEMKPGTTELVKCVSNEATPDAPLISNLKITAVPFEETRRDTGIKTEISVKLKAFKPVKENNDFYSASPWGVLAGSGDTSALSKSFEGISVSSAGQQVASTAGTTPVQATGTSTTSTATQSSQGKVNLQAITPGTQEKAPPKVDVAAASLCEEFYCNSTQILKGASALATAARLIVEEIAGKTEEGLGERISKFVENNGGKSDFTKTIVFQKAGSEQIKAEDFEKAVRAAFDGSKWQPQVLTLSSGTEVKACGIYELKLSVKLPTGFYSDRQSFQNGVNFVPEITQLKKCDEHLFNAALLMGQPSNEKSGPEVTVGRRPVWWPQEIAQNRLFTENTGIYDEPGFLNALEKYRFSLGPYSPDYDARDVQAATQLYQTMFNQAPENSVNSNAVEYSDGTYCLDSAYKQLGAVATAGTLTAAGFALATGGLGTPLLAKMVIAATRAGLSCLAGGIVGGIAGTDTCTGMNICIESSIASAVLPVPGGAATSTTQAAGTVATEQGVKLTGIGFRSRILANNLKNTVGGGLTNAKQNFVETLPPFWPTLGTSALPAAVGGGIEGLASQAGYSTANVPAIPLAAGTTAALQGKEGVSSFTLSLESLRLGVSDAAFAQLIDEDSRFTTNLPAKELASKRVWNIFRSSAESLPRGTAFRPEDLVNYRTKFYDAVETVVKSEDEYAIARRIAPKTLNENQLSTLKDNLWQKATNNEAGGIIGKFTQGRRLPVIKTQNTPGLLKTTLMTLGAIAAVAAFRVDVRPVRAEFSGGDGLAVFHHATEPKGVLSYANLNPYSNAWPTLREVCDGQNGKCYRLENSCSLGSGLVACAKLQPSQNGKYILIATVNEPSGVGLQKYGGSATATAGPFGKQATPSAAQSTKSVAQGDYGQVSKQFFESIFLPGVTPVGAEFGKVAQHEVVEAKK